MSMVLINRFLKGLTKSKTVIFSAFLAQRPKPFYRSHVHIERIYSMNIYSIYETKSGLDKELASESCVPFREQVREY